MKRFVDQMARYLAAEYPLHCRDTTRVELHEFVDRSVSGGPKPVEVPIVEVDQQCLIETFEPDVADVYELVTVEQK
jgi:hypothetical protein